MVEQVDRDAAAEVAPNNESWGVLVRGGALDDDPIVQLFAAHRIAAEARGKEAAARIAEETFIGATYEQVPNAVKIREEIADAIRASIGQENSSEVERLREALRDAVDWADRHDKDPSWLDNARAALNGDQHEG